MRRISSLAVILIILFSACSKDNINFDEEAQLEIDIALIEAYLLQNSLTAEITENNIYYIITQEGTGEYPSDTSNVMVNYRGYFLDGTTFDTNKLGPVNIPLTRDYIPGWKESILLLREGGSGTFFIPSGLGFGLNGTSDGTIPPNSVLIFDVELLEILD